MDWFEELEKLMDTDSSTIASKLGVSREAAEHLLNAVDDYLAENADEGDGGEGEGEEEG